MLGKLRAMRRIGAVLVLVVVAAGTFYWWQARQPVAETQVRQDERATIAEQSPAATAASGQTDEPSELAAAPAVTVPSPGAAQSYAAAATGAAQLPSPGLPLRETAAALLEASRGGSLPATRRLMQELSDCQRHRWASMRMDMMIAFEDSPRAQRRGGDRFREAMSFAAGTVADLAEHCESLPEDFDQSILFEVQRRAADAGDLAGQLAFTLVPALTLNRSLEQLDRLEVYRELAPQFLQRALEQASGQAVAGFMDAYEHVFEGWRGRAAEGTAMQTQAMKNMMKELRPLTPIQQILGEDLVLAYRYALLCKRACNGTDQGRAEAAIARLAAVLEPDQRRQAADDAAELYDAHFHAQARPADIDLESLKDAILGFRR